MTNDELLHKWINNIITAEELEIFKLRAEYDSLTELYANTDKLEAPALDVEGMLKSILSTPKAELPLNPTPKPAATKTINITNWIKIGVAACMLVVAGYFANDILFSKTQLVEYKLAADQKVEGILPDNSAFTLYGDSQLSYDEYQWAQNRVINLEGVAYFKVKKGETFTVKTDLGVVKVIGTQFKVKAKDQLFKVNCNEGKVEVKGSKKGKFSETLIEGEYCLLDNKGMSITKKTEITKLRNVNLQQVLAELKNRYRVNFESDGIDLSEEISCNFKHDDLNLALKTSLSPLGINHSISGNKVSLSLE